MATGPLELKPSEFWELTPSEFNAMVEGWARRQERRIREVVVQAWVTARLVRQKRIPSLATLLGREDPKRRVSVEQRKQEWQELKKEFGLSQDEGR